MGFINERPTAAAFYIETLIAAGRVARAQQEFDALLRRHPGHEGLLRLKPFVDYGAVESTADSGSR